MTRRITIYTDYVCPYCLLAEGPVREAIDGTGITIRWRPFELRPDPVPTLRVEDEYLPRVWRTSVYPMAERLGVPIVLPRISPQPRTDKAFEAFAMAEEKGLGDAFSVRALRAFFQEERDIGDLGVIADIAADVGLDRAEVRTALEEGTNRETHRQALRHAMDEARISAVPTILIGDRRFEGVPSADALERAVEALLSDTRAEVPA